MSSNGKSSFTENLTVLLSAAVVSLAAFLYFCRNGQVLLYGDAVAHLNIARRVLDSLTPGPFELGSVWLPLPHLLMLPFVASDRLWKSGVAASVPSMAAYIAGCAGIYRLVHLYFDPLWAALSTFVYGANPNLLYLQSTAMTEPLYLALLIWSVYFLAQASVLRGERPDECARALGCCGVILALAVMTRYDGWMLAAAMVAAAAWIILGQGPATSTASETSNNLRSALLKFTLLTALVPVLWLVYNANVFGDPLFFARGPYSARAIEQRTRPPGASGHPGDHNLGAATQYFFEAAKLNMTIGHHGNWWLGAALAGTVAFLVRVHNSWPLLLLWIAAPFYVWSIAYGSVPVFVPVWWPFSWYNVRYGLQLLPVFAVFPALLCAVLAADNRRAKAAVFLTALMVVGGLYFQVWRAVPITLQEARVNSRTRIPYEDQLASALKQLPANARLLMYTSAHVGALQSAGVPLRRVISDANDILWQSALANPARAADYVVAAAGDPVAQAVREHNGELRAVAVVDSYGQPRTVIYRSLVR